MKITDIFKRKETVTKIESRSYLEDQGITLNYNTLGCTFKTSLSMNLSSVYRAVSCICDTISSLPVILYETDKDGFKTKVDSPLSYVLSKEPNKKMSASTLYKLLVKDVLLQGNAYCHIVRNGGVVTGIQYIQAGYVTPIDKGDHIEYQVVGMKQRVSSDDIIHILNYSDNGVWGISTLTYARRTLGITDLSEKSAENFYKSGGCASGYLKFTGPSNGKQKEEILSAWNQATGVNSPMGIAVLPSNVDFTQLSINPSDAQMLESRKFEVIEIARFFNIPPSKLFDVDHNTYSSVEANNLQFLTDCIRPLITKIEQEFERKLFPGEDRYDIKFDVSEMLRMDKSSQASYFNQLFQLGVLSPNEIRKSLDMSPVEGGDIHVAQINLTGIKNLESINATDNVDNRLKENIQNNTEDDDTKNNEE